jgi:hypothetical protein
MFFTYGETYTESSAFNLDHVVKLAFDESEENEAEATITLINGETIDLYDEDAVRLRKLLDSISYSKRNPLYAQLNTPCQKNEPVQQP